MRVRQINRQTTRHQIDILKQMTKRHKQMTDRHIDRHTANDRQTYRQTHRYKDRLDEDYKYTFLIILINFSWIS